MRGYSDAITVDDVDDTLSLEDGQGTSRDGGRMGLPVRLLASGPQLWTPARFSRKTAIIIGVSGLFLLFLAALLIRHYTADPHEFPVNEVEVAGTLDYTDRDELRERVIAHTLDGFYSLDLDEIRADVETMPWIAEAHIRRISPDRLSIDVSEHEPTARWNDDSLISKRFELFKPPQLEQDSIQRAEWLAYFLQFPKLGGAEGRHEVVLNAYRTYQNYLHQFGAKIEAVIEDERHSQTVLLANSVSIRLGLSSQEQRMKRFVDVYSRLVPEQDVQAIKFDMRYSNGFAMTRPDTSDADYGKVDE